MAEDTEPREEEHRTSQKKVFGPHLREGRSVLEPLWSAAGCLGGLHLFRVAARGSSNPLYKHLSLASDSQELCCPLHPCVPGHVSTSKVAGGCHLISARDRGSHTKMPAPLSSFLSVSSLVQPPRVCTTHDSLFQREGVRWVPAVSCELAELPRAQPPPGFSFFLYFSKQR